MPKVRMVNGVLTEEPLHVETVRASGDGCGAAVAFPGAGRPLSREAQTGEFDGVRESREAMAKRILSHTDGSDAAREWVAEKCGTAANRWDQGVRNGSIQRH